MNEIINIVKSIAPAVGSLIGGPLAGIAVSWLGEKLLGNSGTKPAELIAALKDPAIIVKLQELENQITLAQIASQNKQIDVNIEEAKSEGFFKSGARPAALWLAVIGWGYNFVIVPICHSFGIPAVGIDTDQIVYLLGGLLGLGGFRTYEKVAGKK